MYTYGEFYNEMQNILNNPFIQEVELKYADPDILKCEKRYFISVRELIDRLERVKSDIKFFRFNCYYHAPSMKLKIVMFNPNLE